MPIYLLKDFKGGGIWTIIEKLHGSLTAIELALLVLFFVWGMVKTCTNLSKVKRLETALRLFLRYCIARILVVYGMELIMVIFEIFQRIISTIGIGTAVQTTLQTEIITACGDAGFFESIHLWFVTLLGGLFITILSFILILTVYGRFFKLYMAVCMEGAIIVLACIIYLAFIGSPPAVDASTSAVSMLWKYIGEIVFNTLVLVGTVKMSDHIVKEMMGL